MWRPEDNVNTVQLFFLRQCLSLALNSQCRLGWVAIKPQRSTCLCFSSSANTRRPPIPSYICVDSEDGTSSTLTTKHSPQPKKNGHFSSLYGGENRAMNKRQKKVKDRNILRPQACSRSLMPNIILVIQGIIIRLIKAIIHRAGDTVQQLRALAGQEFGSQHPCQFTHACVSGSK